MIIDLHCHTKFSGDNNLEPIDLIRAAKDIGLDAICVTEHDTYEESEPVEEVARGEGFTAFRGVEINTDKGHILAFGVTDDSWRGNRPYYSQIEEVRPKVAACGGILIPAHPFRTLGGAAASNGIYDMDYIAAIEVVNGENNNLENDQAQQAWKRIGLPGTGGSDCHFASHVGRCATYFENDVSYIEELISEIRAGRVAPAVLNSKGVFERLSLPF